MNRRRVSGIVLHLDGKFAMAVPILLLLRRYELAESGEHELKGQIGEYGRCGVSLVRGVLGVH